MIIYTCIYCFRVRTQWRVSVSEVGGVGAGGEVVLPGGGRKVWPKLIQWRATNAWTGREQHILLVLLRPEKPF